jgi:MFS family permease
MVSGGTMEECGTGLQTANASAEQGVMGGVITGTAFTAQFPSINTTTAKGNTQLQGFTLGAYNIGSWLGALLTAVIGERLGRKGSVVVGCSIIAIGTALQCSSFQLAQLIVSSILSLTHGPY